MDIRRPRIGGEQALDVGQIMFYSGRNLNTAAETPQGLITGRLKKLFDSYFFKS
jgi:hypothetical protein